MITLVVALVALAAGIGTGLGYKSWMYHQVVKERDDIRSSKNSLDEYYARVCQERDAWKGEYIDLLRFADKESYEAYMRGRYPALSIHLGDAAEVREKRKKK